MTHTFDLLHSQFVRSLVLVKVGEQVCDVADDVAEEHRANLSKGDETIRSELGGRVGEEGRRGGGEEEERRRRGEGR